MTLNEVKFGRRGLLAMSAAVLMGSFGAVAAQDLSGELVILQWQGGVEAELWGKLEAEFMAQNPGVTVRELIITAQGDARGGIRTALMGGSRSI